jgi:RND family efflux transporter MFP subunit
MESQKMLGQNKLITWPILFMAGVFLSVAVSTAAEVNSTSKPALTVKVAQLQPLEMAQILSANGSVLPWQESVISAEITGLRITEVNVSVGDRVQKGDVLATLDSETVQVSETEARASFAESEAVLAEAKANAARSKKLAASGFVSEQQTGQSAASEQTAQARVEVQRARVMSAHLRVLQTRIVAPDSGIISAANAASGSLSQPGVELFRLIRKGYLEWKAELTADELALVKKGMAVNIAAPNGRTVQAKVRAVSPMVNVQTRYGYALVRLPEDSGLIAGGFVRGTFDVGGGLRKVQSLPHSALMQRGSKTYALVIGSDNHVHERPVTVGLRNAERVEIKEGLKEGELVVASGGSFLTEGDVVQVVK